MLSLELYVSLFQCTLFHSVTENLLSYPSSLLHLKDHCALSLQYKRFLGKMFHFQVLLWFTSVCKHRGDPQSPQYFSLCSDGLILDFFLGSTWKQIQLTIAFSLVLFLLSLCLDSISSHYLMYILGIFQQFAFTQCLKHTGR